VVFPSAYGSNNANRQQLKILRKLLPVCRILEDTYFWLEIKIRIGQYSMNAN